MKRLVNKKKIFDSLKFLLFPIVMLFLLGPAEIYYSNKNEFAFGFFDFAYIFIVVAVSTFIVGTIAISLLPKTIYKYITGFIFALSVAMYLQNLLLNKGIFNSDGSAIDWNKYKNYSSLNIIIWIAIFVVVFIFLVLKEKSSNIFKNISFVLGLFQLVSYLIIVVQCVLYPKQYTDNHYTFSGKDQMKYGQENIIVILLDHYPNTQFEDELYSKDKESVEEVLHDFTYYNNANCNYCYTFPSMPAMLTGQPVDPDMTQLEWLEYIWNSEKCIKFYDALHKDGYRCNIYSSKDAYAVFGNIKYLDGKFDNIIEDDPYINYGLMCRLLEKQTIYKYAPYSVKPRFETASYAFKDTFLFRREDGIVAYDNGEFYTRLIDEGLSVEKGIEKEFTFIHLAGTHWPWHTGENGENIGYDMENITSLDETIKGIHVVLNEFLSQLKEQGIYDNSTIIIMSDHGGDFASYSPQPIFFVKCASEHHDEMKVNSSPISYDEFQATILCLAGLDYSDYGETIFDWNDGDIREREWWTPEEGYNVYTYTGNRDDLVEKMKNEEFIHIDSELKDGLRQ